MNMRNLTQRFVGLHFLISLLHAVVTQYFYLLHIMCGYQCDKAANKNDTCKVI